MFLHPHFLWLLLAPLLLAVYQLYRPPGVAGQYKLSATVLRLLALSCVVLALSRPFQQSPEVRKQIVAVIDLSLSMDDDALEQAATGLKSLAEEAGPSNLRLVVLGAEVREIAVADRVPTAVDLQELRADKAGSAVAEALDLAGALCADDAAGTVHLFCDGRETRGDMVAAAARLGRRGLTLEVHELGATASPDPALLLSARSTCTAAAGEAVCLVAEVECRQPVEANMCVTDDRGEVVATRTVSLRAGVQEVAFEVRPEGAGLRHYQVAFDSGDQSVRVALHVDQTVIGVLEDAPDTPGTQAMRDLLGAHAEIKPLSLEDLTDDDLAGVCALAMSDTSAAAMPSATQRKIRAWVENGGGLLVTGGRNAFGPGGYSRSELASMLPLRFPQKKEVRDPSTSLAIIIDTSGSMGNEGVDLAKEVARLALKRLKPHDRAGIVEFHGAKRWAAPLQPASNTIAIQRALNRLSAGGGTVMLPALEEAYYGLLNVHTRTRHVLVLTDGGVEQGAFESLLRRMADDGIHVSTVLVGPRSGSSFLSQLASWGRGQFYTAPSRFKLPEVIVKQPSSSLLNPFVEEEQRLAPVLASRLTQDLTMDDAPALRGYVKTEAKDTAEVLLRSELGDPVLARWHYGLGRVAVLTTQLGGTWAEEFLNWPSAPDLMANLIRQLGGLSPRQPLALTVDHNSAGVDLNAWALSSDRSRAGAPLCFEVRDDSGELIATRRVMPIRAHTWSTRFENLPEGQFLVETRDSGAEGVLGRGALAIGAPREFARIAPDRKKLLTAVRTAEEFAALAAAADAPTRTGELWPLCAGVGLVLFVLMILVRRLPASTRMSIGVTSLALVATFSVGPAALGQEAADEERVLTVLEQQRVDKLLELPAEEGRQQLIVYCRELTQHYGDLQPLCEYLASKGENEGVRSLLAVAAVGDGNLELAKEVLEVLSSEPDADVWTLSEMARLQDIRDDSTGALKTLARALEKTETPAMRFAMLVRTAQLYYHGQQRNQARDTLRTLLATPEFNGPEGRNYCARIAGLHGDDELVGELFVPVGEGRPLMRDRIYFGEVLLRLNKPGEAQEQFVAALTLANIARDRRYILDRIVSASREAGTLSDLMDQWLGAAEILPEQLDILLGVLGGELGRSGDLLDLLQRGDSVAASRKIVQSVAFQQRVILVAIEAGMSDLAARKYRELIANHPNDFHYHMGYARLLLAEDRRDEAQRFLLETVATTKSVSGLMALAAGTRDMALEEIAMEAATKAGSLGELARVQSVLFEAELHRQTGDADKTLQVIRALEEEIGADAELMMPLAEAYERYDYRADAIRMIRQAYDLTGSEKLLQRLITLMEAEQQYEPLFGLYRTLWETATEPMTVIQAQDRLLDIGSKNGKLADLAIELEECLDQGGLSDRQLAMLLEIYTSVNDPVSAADILLEISQQHNGDRTTLYLRLVQVYMECELFGRCQAVLRKLIQIDPENREEHLRSLALIALESKNDGDAMAVLQELAARSDGGELRDSFSASVLNMIGRHEQAARIYRRSLADDPDEVEAWLLWGVSLASLEKRLQQEKNPELSAARLRQVSVKKAADMFSVLLEESIDDDKFTVAIDGLLNARAPKEALRSALRRVNERIALKPHKMFLYRLAADLHDELRQLDLTRAVLEQGVIVADDGRAIILRELIAMAKTRRDQEGVIRYGRSLLNTSEHLPPGECLELGTMLLGKGHLLEADVAFQRVIADGDVMGVARDVILRYENAGLYDKASKLLRHLLVGNPFDVDLLLRLAVIEEKKGKEDAAREAYLQAVDLITGRLPRHSKQVDRTPTHRYGYTRNVDQNDQSFDFALRGLLMSARTSASREDLLDGIAQRVRDELSELEAEDAFGVSPSDNPRLMKLSDLMRSLACAFHRPEYFDPMDDDLLARYDGYQTLFDRLVEERRRRGLIVNAREFLARHNRQECDIDSLAPHLNTPDRLAELLADQEISATFVRELPSLLTMCGHDELIDSVLSRSRSASSQSANLIAVGLASNRPELVRDAFFDALSKARDMQRVYDTATLQKQTCAAWPLLSEEDRKSVANQFGMIAEKTSSYHRRAADAFHHYLLAETGRSQQLDLATIQAYVSPERFARNSEAYTWATVVRWLGDKPASDRPEALQELLKPLEGQKRTDALFQLATLLEDEDVDDAFEEAFGELLKSAPLPHDTSRPYQLFFTVGPVNRLTKHVRQVLIDRKGRLPSFAVVGEGGEGRSKSSGQRLPGNRELANRANEANQSLTSVPLYFRLHDPLALLGGDVEYWLASGVKRMYATRLMKDPEQFLQAVRILMADTRHPNVLSDRMFAFRLRQAPPRLDHAPGGLRSLAYNASQTVLDDLVEIEAGQDELRRWLEGMPMLDENGKANLYRALAESVRRHGLSERIRDELDAAASQSLLSHTDVETVLAVAAGAPEQLPRSLAKEIAPMISLNRTKPSHTIAALADLCEAFGVDHFAQALNRWCVARDVQDRGASPWLGDYLDRLPEKQRCDVLRSLLPHMGINNVRLDATGNEAVLFSALLDLGMDTEANEMIDRYLRRLRLIDAASETGYQCSPFYQQRTMGIDDPVAGDLHDALAVALARLGRPDDYRRVLVRRILLELGTRPQPAARLAILATPGRGYSYSTRATDVRVLEDHSHALPRPDQIEDVGTYLDIHLEVNAWLCEIGKFSPTDHIAQVCLLGRWCAEHGLEDRAVEMSALAAELGDGTSAGHLWIADLHRVLGQEEEASAIECELLRNDQLPIARVPATLKTLAKQESRALADEIAYKLSSYSNHAEILSLALRHAQDHDLETEARDLTERLRKVTTLFRKRS